MKKIALFSILLLSLLLTGCSADGNFLENKMKEKAGIEEDTNYQEFYAYNNSGKLDEQGYYKEDIFLDERIVNTTPDVGTIHVTFASNSYLDITYFKDSACTEPLNDSECYLNPGDCIYSTVTKNDDAPGGYAFSEFQIYRYCEDGKRKLVNASVQDESGLVLELTADYENTEIAVEPVGRYEPLVITLRDYWKDENGSEHELNGIWTIDEDSIIDESVTLNPVSSYIISYDYDESQYFYVSSSPEAFEHIQADGLVIFEQRKPDGNAPTEYTVELHKCITVSIASDVDRKVVYKVNPDISKNDEDDIEQIPALLQDSIDAGGQLKFSGLTYGDTLCIITDKVWNNVESCRQLNVVGEMEPIGVAVDNGIRYYYKYILQVPPAENAFEFNPNEYSDDEHGTIKFTWHGQEITSTEYLPVGSTLRYEAKTHDERYSLTPGIIKIVEDADENRQMLENISFEEQEKITITLKQPDAGGKITYNVGGKPILTNTYTCYTETVITLDVIPWNGWECEINSGKEYVIKKGGYIVECKGDSTDTEIKILDVFSLFKESTRHKPALDVTLDKSLGSAMQFSISASGLSTVSGHFDVNKLKTNQTFSLLKDERIGTEDGISISITNDAVLSGTAVKVLIEKTDTDGNKTIDYRLINDLTAVQEPIDIYKQNELGTSTVCYESIKLTISLVDVMTFKQPKITNATISVKNSVGRYLKTGDIIEGNDKIILTIKPNSGYYVDGKNVENDTYISTMKFSKYQSDIQDIIKNHPIGKYYKITLLEKDTYGVCSYELDGKTVCGTIRAKEGQKLTAQYKITSSGYVIKGAKGIVFGIGKNDQEKTESIIVTNALDGKTVTPEQFGIFVEWGGIM